MTTPLPLGLAPYVSPATLQSASTGIDWSTIPPLPDFDPQANAAELWNMCARATAQVNGYTNQILRATIDTQLLHGPDYYVTVGPASGGAGLTPYWGASSSGNARLILDRWPVLSVSQVQVCPNNLWPRSWTSLPTGFAEPERPPLGIYGSASPSSAADGGQAILVGGGFINWNHGRNGYAIQVTYINGWPHAEISANALAGATSITVDDTTGWAGTNYYGQAGATGVIKDLGQQEAIHVTASSVISGPGTLTLSTPLAYPHVAGTLVTTLPATVEKACIFFAAAEALTRGATSTTIHAVGGHAAGGGGGDDLISEAELLLHPFRRTI